MLDPPVVVSIAAASTAASALLPPLLLFWATFTLPFPFFFAILIMFLNVIY
ncbi:MAG: hypothetical protein [Bacteriophage sp.]|nr:MAG: hypothetical protein [Bacteriophage sp.]